MKARKLTQYVQVRDRATFYLSVLNKGPQLVNSLVLDTLQVGFHTFTP